MVGEEGGGEGVEDKVEGSGRVEVEVAWDERTRGGVRLGEGREDGGAKESDLPMIPMTRFQTSLARFLLDSESEMDDR